MGPIFFDPDFIINIGKEDISFVIWSMIISVMITAEA